MKEASSPSLSLLGNLSASRQFLEDLVGRVDRLVYVLLCVRRVDEQVIILLRMEVDAALQQPLVELHVLRRVGAEEVLVVRDLLLVGEVELTATGADALYHALRLG